MEEPIERKYECSVCKKRFKAKRTLTQHFAVHYEPKFKCNICGHESRRSDHHKFHMERHRSRPNLSCPLASCSMKFLNPKLLLTHLKTLHKINISSVVKNEKQICTNKVSEVTKDSEKKQLELPSPSPILPSTSKMTEIIEKPKKFTLNKNEVLYECCDCKLSFKENSQLWDHLFAQHLDKMKNVNGIQ